MSCSRKISEKRWRDKNNKNYKFKNRKGALLRERLSYLNVHFYSIAMKRTRGVKATKPVAISSIRWFIIRTPVRLISVLIWESFKGIKNDEFSSLI